MKYHIEKNTVQETLIIPLYARKKCSEKFPALYADPVAMGICDKLDYDFSGLGAQYDKTMYEFGALESAMRQLDMMWEINDYIKVHPDAAIVCLGCGLDCDPRRCGNEKNRIFNIDFPDVIKIREELAGKDKRESNIACDLNDFAWMDQIDAQNGAVFYAAGVFYYLAREDVKRIAATIAERFPGSRLIFDTVGKAGYRIMMKSVLKNHGIDDFGTLFYSGNPDVELANWSDKIKVSSRGYMLGYHDLKAPHIRGLYRFLAKAGDNVMKMRIVRMDMDEA